MARRLPRVVHLRRRLGRRPRRDHRQAVADTNGSPGTPSSGTFDGSAHLRRQRRLHRHGHGQRRRRRQRRKRSRSPSATSSRRSPSPPIADSDQRRRLGQLRRRSFTDPGFDNPLNPGGEKAETFTYDIDWGDGRDAITGMTVADTNGSPGTPSTRHVRRQPHLRRQRHLHRHRHDPRRRRRQYDVQHVRSHGQQRRPDADRDAVDQTINEGGSVSLPTSIVHRSGLRQPAQPRRREGRDRSPTTSTGATAATRSPAMTVADTNGSPGTPSSRHRSTAAHLRRQRRLHRHRHDPRR